MPHDLPLAPKHQLLLAQARMKDKDLEEGTPDHPGEPLETAEVNGRILPAGADPQVWRGRPRPRLPAATEVVVQAAMRRARPCRHRRAQVKLQPKSRRSSAHTKLPATGTVVLDVEQGGIEVPSFVGKTVRGAVEAAQDAGLELEAVGSGVARQQSPAAGTHVAAGARVTVSSGDNAKIFNAEDTEDTEEFSLCLPLCPLCPLW